MVFSEWGGTGLLFIAHKVKFVAWAYEYQAGSGRVCLSQTRFWCWPPEGRICHSDLFWLIEKKITIWPPILFCNETTPGGETRNESEKMICDCDNDNEKEIDTDEGNAFEGKCIKCALFW